MSKIEYLQHWHNEYAILMPVCVCSVVATGTSEPTVSLNGSPAKGSFPTQGRARSCTSHLPSSTPEPVQTQQPCSLKGSLSSDNIYGGLQGDGTGTQAPPGQGEHTTKHLSLTVFTQIQDCKHVYSTENK